MRFLIWVLTLALALPALAQGPEELEVDHALTFEFQTPHTDWAQPYALGKTRVLFITNGHGTVPRECVELMQRFDLEAEAAFYATIVDSPTTQWHGGDVGVRRLLKLLEKQWDCFVFLGMGTEQMSPEMLYKMVKPVTEGAGIVMAGGNDARVLLDKNKVDPLPAFLSRATAGRGQETAPTTAGAVGEAFKVGKGRGMRLPGQPSIGYAPGWEQEYDYWQERLGRAVLWAAGKEPKVSLNLSGPLADESKIGGRVFIAKPVGEVAGEQPIITAVLRKPGGDPAEVVQQAAPIAAEAQWTIPEGKLRAGEYHFDVFVKSSAGVEAWDTIPFTVTKPRTVKEVQLATGWGEVGDTLAGTVALDGPPMADELLRVQLRDRRGRVLGQKDVDLAAEPPSFEFAIEAWMPMLVTVEASLWDPRNEVSRAWKYFHVTKRNRDQFNFLIWDVPVGTLAPYAEENLWRNGMTLQLRGGTPPDYVAAFDTAWVPYTTRILSQSKTPEGVMQPFCWNDEEKVQETVNRLAEEYRGARQHGVFVYSLGDENDTLGSCLSPQCATAYRRYLLLEYDSLAGLNAEWGTDFKTWDEVGLSTADDNEEANSLREKNYPRWFDRQAFKSYNYVQYCAQYDQAYAGIDPEGWTGFEGAGGFATGDDLDLIVRTLKFWSPYPGTADEVVRSIAPRQMPRANWMGYTKDADSLVSKYWRMVTRGMDAVWFWRWDCIGSFHGWLAPDLRPYPAVQDIVKDTQVMRDGLGDLLLKSEMQDDGIAMLYSYPSVFAHKLEEGASFGGYESAHLGAMNLVRHFGLQFRYVTDRMLRLGEFDKSKYEILILARAEAMDDRTAQVIREFVEGGGTVIADVRPGLYDGHCKPRERGALDDLFGIERTGRPEAKKAEGVKAGVVRGDPGIRVTSGRAMNETDGVPYFVLNRTGAGSTLLLNLDFASYPVPTGLETRELEKAEASELLFRYGGVEPQVEVRSVKGVQAQNVEVTRWVNGDTQVFSLFREAGVKEQVTVRLAEPAFVYDLRQRKALGKVQEFETGVLPCRASFFAVCKEAPPAAQLVLDKATARRGEVLKATLSVPGAKGLYAFRIRAKCGESKLEWLDRNVMVGAEPVSFEVPIAYNDPQGAYEVQAVELFGEGVAAARVEVR